MNKKILEENSNIKDELKNEFKKQIEENNANNENTIDEKLEAKIQDMQNKTNKVFTNQLNKIKAQNQSALDEQVQDISSQINTIVAQEIEKIKVENKKLINDKIARLQIQSEAEVEKKVRKIQTEYEKKLRILQQTINNFMQEQTKKRSSINNVSPVFSYDEGDDSTEYNNIYKNIKSSSLKHAAKNYLDNGEDENIINFFDDDEE